MRNTSGVAERERRRWRRQPFIVGAAFAATVAIMASALSPSDGAIADTAPTNPADTRTPETVSGDLLPTPQIGSGLSDGKGDVAGSGVVWDQVVIGDTVFVGGDFQVARPSGAKAGERVVKRSNFLAYNLKTGDLLDYAPSFNAQIRTLAASPDGKRLYAGGSFTEVNGIKKYRIAAFDVATGALIGGFDPGLNSRVNTIVATNSAVYLGGWFTAAGGKPRQGLASFEAASGALRPWAPAVAGGEPVAMVISPDEKKIVVAGSFTSLNGSSNPGWGMGAVNASDEGKAVLPWKANASIRNAAPAPAAFTSLASDGKSVYGTAYSYAAPDKKHLGSTEATFRASWTDGALEWHTDCHGDTYSVFPSGGAVYTAGHAHGCGTMGGFPEGSTSVSSDQHHRALAFSAEATGTLKKAPALYIDFGGQPSPSLLDWYPDFGAGLFTGMNQGPWDVTAAQGYVLYGGEFTQINGVAQRGLIRFAPKNVAPNKEKPQLEGAAMRPTVVGFGGTYAKLRWPANYDRDNARLTYQVVREPGGVVFETTVESRFWQRPTLSAADGYLTPGQTYTYRIKTIDPFGNARWGDAVSYTVPASSTAKDLYNGYDKTVLQDQPSAYWPMNETSGPAYDWIGGGTIQMTGPTRRGSEGIAGGRATTFANSGLSYGYSDAVAAPSTYSAELWFKTTDTGGGELISFGSTTDMSSPARDRKVYLNAAGKITFAMRPNAQSAITSETGYNDGTWHHLVASTGPDGMRLVVDDKQIGVLPSITSGASYTGRWIVGGHDLYGGWPNVGPSHWIGGEIDNVAVYNRVLTPTETRSHFEAGAVSTRNTPPSSSFTVSASGLVAAVDGSGSVDSDGQVVSFAWDFGDGATGSGMTASHAYAKAGDYTVKLTVTDDRGATNVSSQIVAVDSAPQPQPQPGVVASDTFERSVASGWGQAAQGGAWKQSWSPGDTTVGSGAGSMAFAKGETRTATLPEVSVDSTDSTVSFRIGAAPSGGGQYVSVIGRQVGSESYVGRVWIRPNGALQLQLQRNGVVLKAVDLTGVSYAQGQQVFVRLQVTGKGTTTLNAKVWTTGAEPGPWQATATDTTATLQAAGGVGLGGYLSASATAGVAFTFDDYTVKRMG